MTKTSKQSKQIRLILKQWSQTGKRASFPQITEKQAVIYLKSVWEGICPPVHEDSLIDLWFAAIYYPEVMGDHQDLYCMSVK